MLQFRDFVPRMLVEPGLFKEGQHESLDDALEAANQWLAESHVQLVNVETVVLPNIWSRWEQGSADTSLGVGSPSHWHQFIRCWYEDSAG